MRARTILTILLALMICVPVQGSSSAVQDEEVNDDACLEDPEQPCNNQTTLYLWSNGMSTFWSHFNTNETDNVGNNLQISTAQKIRLVLIQICLHKHF